MMIGLANDGGNVPFIMRGLVHTCHCPVPTEHRKNVHQDGMPHGVQEEKARCSCPFPHPIVKDLQLLIRQEHRQGRSNYGLATELCSHWKRWRGCSLGWIRSAQERDCNR